MNKIGKTIQIFLPDGNPRSVKIAEITSRTVQVILIPRLKLDYIFARRELTNVGVYFLIGNPEEEARAKIYIGEAEDCKTRLKQHNTGKEFWNYALVIISKTKYFTKTHIKFLESYLYIQAEKVGRYNIINSSKPNTPFISESMEADLLDNFETIKILTSTLGFPIFDEKRSDKKTELLYCKGNKADARGQYNNEGFTVLSGSTANVEETKTAQPWLINMRKKLIESGILVKENNIYIFKMDYVFASPSSAAGTILGRSSNGWTEWKYKNGKTLDEIQRKKKD